MSKKTAIIILLIVLLVSGGVVLYQTFFTGKSSDQTAEGTKNRLGSFFPTSKDETENQSLEVINQGPSGQIIDEKNIPKLRQISSTPTSGATVFTRIATTTETIDGVEKISTTTETVFRYAERATGHIYENLSTSLISTRISNTSIPKNFSTVFSNNGKNIIFSTLGEVRKNFAAKIVEKKPEETVGSVAGSFLTHNTENISTLDNNIAYSRVAVDQKYGVSFGLHTTSFNSTSTSTKAIFTSPQTEWLVDWVDKNTLSLNSKPSYSAPGFLYEIKTTGERVKILDEVYGLNSKSNSDYVIFSETTNKTIRNFLYTKKDKTFKDLSTISFPREKCVFGVKDKKTAYCASPTSLTKASYPDDWYLGLVSNNDLIFKINLEKGTSEPIAIPEVVINNFDIKNIYISPNDDFLLFINKKDLTLWSLEIN